MFKKLILSAVMLSILAQPSMADERQLVTATLTADEYAAFLFSGPTPVALKYKMRGILLREESGPAPETAPETATVPAPEPVAAATPVRAAPVHQGPPEFVPGTPPLSPRKPQYVAISEPAVHRVSAPTPASSAEPRVLVQPVNFASNSSDVPASFKEDLMNLAAAMKRPEAQGKLLVITGHTDSMGAADYNLLLSVRRARSVENFLIAQGVRAEQLVSTGKGMSRPLPGRDNLDGLNRRVEFKVAAM